MKKINLFMALIQAVVGLMIAPFLERPIPFLAGFFISGIITNYVFFKDYK